MVARARQAGLVLTPRQLFEHPTIAQLAALAGIAGEAAGGPSPSPSDLGEGPAEGEVPLLPIQRWFLETGGPDLHHFAQAVLLDVSAAVQTIGPLSPPLLARALHLLADRHDALRLRFTREPDGGWHQAYAPVETSGDAVPFLTADLSALPTARWPAAVSAGAAALQAGFDLERGPLFLGALFAEERGPARLLLAAHHLVVDTVSWRILVEDLETAWGQLAMGRPVRLPGKTTSFKRWAKGLVRAARSPELAADREHWLGLAATLTGDGAPASLPAEIAASAAITAVAATTALPDAESQVSELLSPEVTEALLRRAPAAYRTQVNELLLTALALALGADRGPVLVDLEGHGREDELLPGADLSRTVGWFTSVFPLALDLRGAGGPGAAIRRIKETVRGVPHRGLGYGLLRYLGSAEERQRLADLEAAHPAAIAWNYLGQLDRSFASSSALRLAPEPTGTGQGASAPHRHPLVVNAMVLGDRLRVDWSFPATSEAREATLRLARGFVDALTALLDHCLSPAAGGYTPSDFPLARLDAATLDELLSSDRDVQDLEDLYPLAPLQQGMLFHDLYAPGSGLYLQQLTCTLSGPLDREAFRRAWQGVVDRHPALRTAFLWQGLARPLQAVRRNVDLPWEEVDLRGTSAAELPGRLGRLAADLLSRGFDPGRAPLMRAALARTGEEEHRFLWTFHHLLFDGWCLAILFRDVFALYQAAVAGPFASTAGIAGLPPAPPYRDYIAWLEGRDTAAAERYWRGVLAGFAEPTRLPFDRPKALSGSAETGGDLELVLPAATTADLAALARASELTLNTLFQGVWALLLSRYGGGRDVVFGTVVAGRPPELPGVETMVGLFINTLPVRLDPDPAVPAGVFLRGAQARQVEMRQYEHAPLAEVQRSSEIPPGEALFQSLFVFENYPVDDSLGEGAGALAVRDVRIADRTDYPLSLAVGPTEAGRRLTLRFVYDGHLETATVERLARHFVALLTGLAEGGGERPLGAIPLLSAAERRQLLADWGSGGPARASDSASELCLHELFAAQAARTPGAPALLQGGRAITYAELARAAAALALRLRELGVGPEVRVPLLAERSPEAIVGIVAVLAAGGAYVPLDPGTPVDRLTPLLCEIRGSAPDLGPRPLLLTARTAARLPAAARAGFLPVLLDGVLDAPSSPVPAPSSGVLPENLAYVLYTSGSTGAPKGVMVSHRAIATYVRTVVAEYGIGPGDRELQASALSFDPSVEEIFAPLAAGGAVVLPEGGFEEPVRFLDFCRRTELTLLSLPTAYWHTFVATLAAEALPAPPRVRLIIMGGERALPERWAAWAGLGGGDWGRVRLVNGYGPTEATVVATLETHPGAAHAAIANIDGIAGIAELAGKEVPIGLPLPGVTVRVLDPGYALALEPLEPLPPGAPGELFLGGTGLARGYLGHPGLTAERFVPDPWAAERGEPGARLYRTGDLVRFLPDGRLEFLGRADSQVKVRGYRIELGEVETALAAHPAVLEAAAGTRADASGSRSLVAWVVPRSGEASSAGSSLGALDAAALERFLAGRLPAYMVPSEIAFLPALPRSSADKVDRRALALLAPAPRPAGEGYVAPRNAMEEELAALWRELLGVERVGVADDFFALGGHSLLATQLVSRLRRQLGVDLPLARLFELRTLEAVAEEVLGRQLAAGGEGVDELLADLDGLSDEEALALLAAEEEERLEGRR